ncbi:hypothetical protein GVN20_04575 [Runella sp. CRIBMP]|nr:hypothetical protein [Runella sp. CRIBMP]NBB18624.1 hypothetical protein [Runella sp. CRIBMP]
MGNLPVNVARFFLGSVWGVIGVFSSYFSIFTIDSFINESLLPHAS